MKPVVLYELVAHIPVTMLDLRAVLLKRLYRVNFADLQTPGFQKLGMRMVIDGVCKGKDRALPQMQLVSRTLSRCDFLYVRIEIPPVFCCITYI